MGHASSHRLRLIADRGGDPLVFAKLCAAVCKHCFVARSSRRRPASWRHEPEAEQMHQAKHMCRMNQLITKATSCLFSNCASTETGAKGACLGMMAEHLQVVIDVRFRVPMPPVDQAVLHTKENHNDGDAMTQLRAKATAAWVFAPMASMLGQKRLKPC